MALEELTKSEWFHPVLIVGWGISVALIYWLSSWGVKHYTRLRNRLRVLEEEMARRRQKRRDRKYIADVITDAFEREYNAGRMSHEMYWYWFKQFGNNCGLLDLLPTKVPRKNHDVKEDIIERVGEGKLVQLRAKKTKASPILAALERHTRRM